MNEFESGKVNGNLGIMWCPSALFTGNVYWGI